MSRRRNRFPLYAPAELEARLNPSSPSEAAMPVGLLASAVVSTATPAAPEVGDPPVVPVTVPIGPAVPA